MSEPAPPVKSGAHAAPDWSRVDLLKWLYVGRLTLAAGILVAGLVTWFDSSAAETLFVSVLFMVSVAVTVASLWHTHVLRREPSPEFLYGQVIFDAFLVTGIVHLTGGPASGFASLYVLVISAGALLLPLVGGLLLGLLTSLLYAADLILAFGEPMSAFFGLRLVLFGAVAVITALIGDRLRTAGQALGAVASELRQLRLDTDDILANLSTGVITVDGDGCLAYANQAAEGLLGIGLRTRLGEPILDELDEVAPTMGSIIQQAIHRRAPVSRGQVEITTEGGPVRLGVSTAVLERESNELPSATALFQDITDLQRLEQLKVRTERLQAVATLSASLAHEIKNPLASIRSAVEQLSRGRLSDEDRAVLERLVLTESDRLSRLLSEFLDFSGLGMGDEKEEIDLQTLVRGCLLIAKQHPDLKGVDVVATLEERPIQVVGDADLLHRALFNLVLNGAQSAGSGGRVSVALRLDQRRSRPRAGSVDRPVRLSVGDSGPGIDEHERVRVFDPFFTTKTGGSGLGLAVVHRAVEAHSGVIFVDASSDGGADFVIHLPGAFASAPVATGAVR